MCREKHCKSSSWLVNSARWFVMHEHVNIHILLSLLWNYEHTVMCEKCLVQTEESVLLQLVCTGPLSCVWHTSNCIKTFFFPGDVVRLGAGVWWSMFYEVGGLYGVSERGGGFEFRALTAWEKSCWAAWRAAGWAHSLVGHLCSVW